MKIDVTAAGEKWLPWAKRKLEEVTALRADLRLPALTKVFAPAAGARVYLRSTEWGDFIRIQAGVSRGRVMTLDVNGHAVNDRLYVVRKHVLDEFNYTDGTDRAFHSSLNGRALSYFGSAPDDFYRIARRARTSQVTAAAAPAGFDTGALPLLVGGGRNNFTTSQFFLLGDDATIMQSGAMMCSDDGNDVAVVSDFLLPKVFRVSEAQRLEESLPPDEWSADTAYDLVYEGLPSFVGEFYASLPIQHSHDEVGSFSMNVYALRTNAFPAATIGPVYWLFVSSTITGAPPGSALRMQFFTVLDHSSGKVLLLSCMPYVTGYADDPVGGNVTADVNARISLHELVGDSWSEVYHTDVVNGLQLFFNEAGAPATGTFEGLPYAVVAAQLNGGYNRLMTSYYVPMGRGTAPKLGELLYNREVLSVGAALTSTSPNFIKYTEDGEVLFADIPGWDDAASVAGQIALLARGRHGYLFDIRPLSNTPETYAWYSRADSAAPFERTVMTDDPVDLFLSSDGNKLWTRDNLHTRYYELGQLLLTTSVAPAADAGTFATYGTAPDEGFYFVEALKAWSYTREAFRAVVSTHVEQTGPSSYEWRTATAMLQYKDGAVRVVETLSDVPVDYPSRGRLPEDDPSIDPPVQSLSDAELWEDEFFPDVI